MTVVIGPAKEIRVETAADGSGEVAPAQNSPPGMSITVYSVVRDAGGDFLSNGPATWSLSTKTSGVVSGDLVVSGDNLSATFTGNLSGTANIRATSGVDFGGFGSDHRVARVTWVGGGANPWDFSTANWTIGSAVAFLDSDDVTFDGSGSMSPAVNITTTVKPHSMNVTAGPYTFGGGGGIAGVCAVNNSSGTRLTFLTTNTYSGPTAVTFGSELQLGNGGRTVRWARACLVQTGGTSPIFNRTDSVGAPYVVSNVPSGTVDFHDGLPIRRDGTEGQWSQHQGESRRAQWGHADPVRCGHRSRRPHGSRRLRCHQSDCGGGGRVQAGRPQCGGDHLTAAGRLSCMWTASSTQTGQ